MNTQLLTIAVGLLLLIGGVSAVGAAAPPEAGSLAETPSTSTDTDATVGPPGGLPDPVPDFVGDILGAISDLVASVIGGGAESATENSIKQVLTVAIDNS